MSDIGKARLLCLLLMASVLVVYGQAATFDFINFDDGLYVSANDRVQAGLTLPSLRWALTTFHAANWHPLTWVSHMLDWEIFGAWAGGHHLASVLLHAANTLLLFLFLREATGRIRESAWVCALWALHPLHAESVAWVSERKDVLSAFFWMLTLLFYLRYVRRPGPARYLAVGVSLALGLMAKPMLVTLPMALLLLDYWPLKRFGERTFSSLVLEKVPLLFLSAASSLMTFLAQSRGGAVSPLDIVPFQARLFNAVLSYARYLGKLLWPHDLAIFYPYAWAELRLWRVAVAAAGLLGLTAVVLKQARRRPFLPVGWFWFLGTLVPVIGLVQVGGQAMADRYTYIPSLGIYIMAAWLAGSMAPGRTGRAKAVDLAAVILCICLAGLTWQHAGDFRNSRSVFEHALAVTRNNYLAHNNLGVALDREGRLQEALAEYRQALAIWQDYADARSNVGYALARLSRPEEALEALDRALASDPRHADAHRRRAAVLRELDCPREAEEALAAASLWSRDDSWTHNLLGAAWAAAGRLDRAREHFQRALDLAPWRAETHNNLGRVLAMAGDFQGSLEHLEHALELRPEFPEALNNLGLTLAATGWLEGAAYAFGAALIQRPDYDKARANFQAVIGRLCASEKGKSISLQGKTP